MNIHLQRIRLLSNQSTLLINLTIDTDIHEDQYAIRDRVYNILDAIYEHILNNYEHPDIEHKSEDMIYNQLKAEGLRPMTLNVFIGDT